MGTPPVPGGVPILRFRKRTWRGPNRSLSAVEIFDLVRAVYTWYLALMLLYFGMKYPILCLYRNEINAFGL
jgi:hypothetical protein